MKSMAWQQKKPVQLTLDDARKPEGHGGWRPGAGRPKGRTTVSREKREEFASRYPVLVTWRIVEGVPSLRCNDLVEIVVDAVRRSNTDSFGIVDFSVQTNHLHYGIEAAGKVALARGMQRLAARLTGPLNHALGRTGKLFETRYHARVLKTPREVKNAVRYVLLNIRHHVSDRDAWYDLDWIDPYSSAAWFDGWARPIPRPYAPTIAAPTAAPTTWLRRVGWRRWGLLDFDEVPGGA